MWYQLKTCCRLLMADGPSIQSGDSIAANKAGATTFQVSEPALGSGLSRNGRRITEVTGDVQIQSPDGQLRQAQVGAIIQPGDKVVLRPVSKGEFGQLQTKVVDPFPKIVQPGADAARAPAPLTTLRDVHGTAEIHRAGTQRWEPVQPGAVLGVGDELRISNGQDDKARIFLPNGEVEGIPAGTTYKIREAIQQGSHLMNLLQQLLQDLLLRKQQVPRPTDHGIHG